MSVCVCVCVCVIRCSYYKIEGKRNVETPGSEFHEPNLQVSLYWHVRIQLNKYLFSV